MRCRPVSQSQGPAASIPLWWLLEHRGVIRSDNDPRRAAYSGSLIGPALGDALGFVVEGEPPEVCREYVEVKLKAGRAGEHGRDLYPFG
jgi:hypothetical protein